MSEKHTCNIALLEVALHGNALFVAHATLSSRHETIARLICFADIAIDASPALVALTLILAFCGPMIVASE